MALLAVRWVSSAVDLSYAGLPTKMGPFRNRSVVVYFSPRLALSLWVGGQSNLDQAVNCLRAGGLMQRPGVSTCA